MKQSEERASRFLPGDGGSPSKKIILERRVVDVLDVVTVGKFIANIGKEEEFGGVAGGEAFQAFCDLMEIDVETMFALVGPPKNGRAP